jgi:hypothetical protein
MKFPRLVYKSTDGKTFIHVQVTTKEEHSFSLSEGWAASVPEAFDDFNAPPVKTAPAPPSGRGRVKVVK